MRAPLPLGSLALLSLSALACAGPAGEEAQVLGVKRTREGTSATDEPSAKRTLPNEQLPLEWAAKRLAEMLANLLGSESFEHESLETADQKQELVNRLYQDFINVFARSTLESLICARPPPGLSQELLNIYDALLEKIERTGLLSCLYSNPWDSSKAWHALKGHSDLHIDKLENGFGWLRIRVFESMKVEAKGRILDMLTDLSLRLMLKWDTKLATREMASLPGIVKKLEEELDRLNNWDALQISMLISAILLALVGFMPANDENRVPAVDTAFLLTVKYLKRQLPLDLQEMIDDGGLNLSNPSHMRFKYIGEYDYFTIMLQRQQPVSKALDWAEEHFENELASLFDNMLKNLRFQAEVMQLTSHAPQFPEQIIASTLFDSMALSEMSGFLEYLRGQLTDREDPRLERIQHYYDLFTQLCGHYTQTCREYAHVPGLAEEKVLKRMRKYLPDFVPPAPRVSTKGAHNVKAKDDDGNGDVPEDEPADQATETQEPSVAQAHGDQQIDE